KMKLRSEALVKRYKKRTVVNHVSIEMEQGEIVGLLGPNGAGKTTSFYMIVGLIKPDEGQVFLDELDITKEPMYRRAQLVWVICPRKHLFFASLQSKKTSWA